MNLIAGNPVSGGALFLVETAFTTEQKQWLFDECITGNKEGVVFKRLSAAYIAGRPNTGGDQLKYQFRKRASFIVGNQSVGKRSVQLRLFNANRTALLNAGNVTIPPNFDVPKPDAVVEARYLYAFRESGCVFQPVYLGERDDVDQNECTVQQLKFKAEPVAA